MKPIRDNQGGMKSPHMFATWFMLKKINPVNVIESGIWKGQSAWLIEKTLPNANIFSIDLNLNFREYISERVKYFDVDFNQINWSFIEDKENTLLFFDDHQNAFERIKNGKELGFKQFIFEDNYPKNQGDCYSLKKAFQHGGFSSVQGTSNLKVPNRQDAKYLKDNLEIYFEFPPVFKTKKTRWGDLWIDKDYPTPTPLFSEIEQDELKIFKQEATDYTWICYAKLGKL